MPVPQVAIKPSLTSNEDPTKLLAVQSNYKMFKPDLVDLKNPYTRGMAISATVSVQNTADESAAVPALHPSYGVVALEIQRPDQKGFSLHRPWSWRCANPGRSPRKLEPKESAYAEAKLFYSAEQLVFRDPGQYLIRASLPGDVTSDVKEIDVTSEKTDADKRAWEMLKVPDRALFLFLDGADHLEEAKRSLTEFHDREENEEAAAMPDIRIALGMAALRPTLRLGDTQRAEPRLDEAEWYLGRDLGYIWDDSAQLPPFTVIRAAKLYIAALEHFDEDPTEVRKQLKIHLGNVESVRRSVDELAPGTVDPPPPTVLQAFVIQTDEIGAAAIRTAAETLGDVQFETRKAYAQVGGSDTWTLVAQVDPAIVDAFSGAILPLIRQQRINYMKIGNDEFRYITVEQFQKIMGTTTK